jgi:acyl carrier protein
MNDQNIKETLRQFILTTYLPGEPPETLRDVTPLQTSGILDSLAVETLVAFIHERFGIDVDVYDMSVDRFDRIEDIAAAIERKQAQRS